MMDVPAGDQRLPLVHRRKLGLQLALQAVPEKPRHQVVRAASAVSQERRVGERAGVDPVGHAQGDPGVIIILAQALQFRDRDLYPDMRDPLRRDLPDQEPPGQGPLPDKGVIAHGGADKAHDPVAAQVFNCADPGRTDLFYRKKQDVCDPENGNDEHCFQ